MTINVSQDSYRTAKSKRYGGANSARTHNSRYNQNLNEMSLVKKDMPALVSGKNPMATVKHEEEKRSFKAIVPPVDERVTTKARRQKAL